MKASSVSTRAPSRRFPAATAARRPSARDAGARSQALDRLHAIAEFAADGTLLDANANFLGFIGCTLADVQGQPHAALLPVADREGAIQRQLWTGLATGKAQTVEARYATKDGHELWLSTAFEPLASGTFLCVATDVTERRAIAAEIADLKVRAEITNLTSIVSEADLKGDIVSCNDKFCQVSQYNRDELVGRGHNTTRHPDMPKEVFKELWATIGRGKIFRGVVKNRKKDGTPYYVDAVIAPVLGENGKPRKYIGVRYEDRKSVV